MPGTVTYNGQAFSHDDFISHLSAGGLDELISNNPKIHDYAENLRGNPGQNGVQGNASQGGEDTRRENLQLGAQQELKPSETQQQTGRQKKVEPAPVQGQAGSEPVNPTDAQVKAWTLDYINSPMYMKRLTHTWVHPDLVQKLREGKMAGTTFTETPAGGTNYSDDPYFPNQVNLSDQQIKDLGISRAAAIAHEMGHGTNANLNSKYLQLNPVEENYIISRNKNITGSDIPDFLKAARGDTLSGYLKGDAATHDLAPSESMSDIQALRYILHQKGLYDARTQDLTPELMKKAANDPDIKNSFIWKRLHQNFDDKAIMDINNMIAFGNPSDLTQNTA